MNTKLLSEKMLKKISSASLLVLGALAPVVADAQILNYEWSANATGYWYNGNSWSPNAADRIGALTWGNLSRFDRVTISGNYTVTNDMETRFMTSNVGGLAGADKRGNFNAVALSGGAKLVISNAGGFGVSTSSGGYVRNVFIGAGSELDVRGRILTGAQNNTNDLSTWTIQGTVKAYTFLGQQGSGSASLTGGYQINLDGGQMEINGLFDWRTDQGMGTHGGEVIASTSTVSTAGIHISNGGLLDVDTMSASWIASSNAYVSFLDGTGSLTFGKTNYATLSDIEALISGNHIRKGVGGDFDIQDNGSSWTVTVAIPESSTSVLLLGGIVCTILGGRAFLSRRASR